MVSFGHTAVGTGVGILAYNFFGEQHAVVGLLTTGAAALLSHYITDFIPHGHFIRYNEFKSKVIKVIIFDLLVSIIVFTSLIYFKDGLGIKLLYILFGIGGSQLPDVFDGLIYSGVLPDKGVIRAENEFHQDMHWHGKREKGLMLGKSDIWQLSVVIVVLSFAFLS